MFHLVLFQLTVAAGSRRRRQHHDGSNRPREDADRPDPSHGGGEVIDGRFRGLQDHDVLVDDRHEVILHRAGPCRRPRRPVLISRHVQRVADQRSPAGKSQLQSRKRLISGDVVAPTRLWIRELSAQRHASKGGSGGL
ncbi:hypothetical protein [Brevundimonas sp. UBA2416]|uniref:hypothetical protein n=1 Tax=Brevundimonas sp. UBA2416 TaxID=1946124 RepID=UPI0025C5EE71|nr:hypothetical protein [Brevundimonas sp. UBA2416]